MIKDRFMRRFWISMSIIVGSIVVAGLAIDYFSGSLSAEANIIVGDRTTIQRNTDAVASLAQLKSAAPQAARYQAAMDQILPDQYGLVTFTQWFSQLGQKYNVTTNAAFQGSVVPTAATVAGSAQFSFSAVGSPADISAFLNAVDSTTSGFIVSLSTFDVASDGTNETITGQGQLFFH